jgi:hypothetical protein
MVRYHHVDCCLQLIRRVGYGPILSWYFRVHDFPRVQSLVSNIASNYWTYSNRTKVSGGLVKNGYQGPPIW